MANYIVVLSM